MTLKRFRLDYTKCSLEELQGFMRARGVVLKKEKEACIIALQLADSNATFRFEDLPGELRNRVYYELLLLPNGNTFRHMEYRKNYKISIHVASGCYPHILATAASIRDEASSILYGANELQINVQRYISRHVQTMGLELHHWVEILRLPMPSKSFEGPFGCLRTHFELWPSCLLKFQNVRIHIDTGVQRYRYSKGGRSTEITHTLYSLASFLQRSTDLKTLRIFGDTAQGSDLVTVSKLSKVLYPLARLVPKLKLEGFADYPTLEQHLCTVATAQEEFDKQNVLHYAFLVRDESEAYKAMTRISSNTSNLRQHIKLRPQMCRVFDQPFEKQEDEQRLLEWADRMAEFLTKAHEEEVGMALSRGSGFWMAAVKRFDAAHKKRIMHFPEPVEEE